jgi:hypothetical protein
MILDFLFTSSWAAAQSIDGVPIGANTPSTGKFTTLEVATLTTTGAVSAGNVSASSSLSLQGKSITTLNQVQTTALDNVEGFLKDELVEGANVTISEVGVGGNKKLQISSSLGTTLTT